MPVNKSPIRVSEEAVKWAKIASGYTGESISAYVGRVIVEQARKDVEKHHAELTNPTPPPKPDRKK